MKTFQIYKDGEPISMEHSGFTREFGVDIGVCVNSLYPGQEIVIKRTG